MELEPYRTYLRYELNRSAYTVSVYMADLERFLGWYEQNTGSSLNEARAISSKHIREWLAQRAREGCAPRSIRRYASSIAAFFHYLQLTGAVDSNPCKGIKLPRIPQHLPSPVDESEMEKALSEDYDETSGGDTLAQFIALRNKLVIELLYATGMRRAELHSLNDSDISAGMQRLQVTGKRSKQRIIPLAPALLQRIHQYQILRNNLFPAQPPSQQPLLLGKRGGRLNFTSIAGIVKEELAMTHASRKSPHTLRHTFATSMLRGGADLRTLKELLGHSSLATTQIYTHLSVEELKNNYNLAHPKAQKKD